MTKNIIAFGLFLASAPFAVSKEPSLQSMQVSFFSNALKNSSLASEDSSEVEYCVDVLKKISETQKKRRLTIEEMMMAIQVMFFLFEGSGVDHSRWIEILVNGKHKINVPYSSQVFGFLHQQGSDSDDDDDEDDETY